MKLTGWIIAMLLSAAVFVTQLPAVVLGVMFDRSYHPALLLAAVRSSHREVNDLAWVLGLAGFGVWVIGAGAVRGRLRRRTGARWASRAELRARGLLSAQPRRVVLGRWKKHYVCDTSDEHVLVAAPTRAGKGVGLVIPTALCWGGSLIVLDVKGEVFDMTSGWRRAMGDQVYVLNPFAGRSGSHRFNPIDVLAAAPEPEHEATRLAAAVLPMPAGVKDPFWINSARELFAGALLFSLSTASQRQVVASIGDALSILTPVAGSSDSVRDRLSDLLEAHSGVVNPVGEQWLRSWSQEEDPKVRGNVLKTVTSATTIFMIDSIRAVTEASDFNVWNLRKVPMTVYIVIAPTDLEALGPLIRLFVWGVISANTRVLPDQDETLKHQALLLLDEFPLLGRCSIIEDSIGVTAGYGLRHLTIVQSNAQLAKTYGPIGADVLQDAHGSRVQFGLRRVREAREISESLGQEKVLKSGSAKSVGEAVLGRDPREQNESLMRTDDVLNMSESEALLSVRNLRPIKMRKIVYFKDREFVRRTKRKPYHEPYSTPPAGP